MRAGAIYAGLRLPIVTDLADTTAFEGELAAAEADNVIMIVKQYQPRCRACRDLGRKLDILARKRPQHRVFEVDIKSPGGRSITRKYGLPDALPHVAIYERGKMVWSKALPARLFGEVEEVLDRFDGDNIREDSASLGDLALDAWSNFRRSRQK